MESVNVNLFLHDSIKKIIDCMGNNLDDAINRILDKLVENNIALTDYPKCPDKQGCNHYVVAITNKDYVELSKIYKQGDARFSLRRLL